MYSCKSHFTRKAYFRRHRRVITDPRKPTSLTTFLSRCHLCKRLHMTYGTLKRLFSVSIFTLILMSIRVVNVKHVFAIRFEVYCTLSVFKWGGKGFIMKCKDTKRGLKRLLEIFWNLRSEICVRITRTVTV